MALYFKGTGTAHLGFSGHASDGHCFATVWLVLFYLPVFPLRRERIRPEQLNHLLDLDAKVIEVVPMDRGADLRLLASVYLVALPLLVGPSFVFLAAVISTDFFEGWRFWLGALGVLGLGVGTVFAFERVQRWQVFRGRSPVRLESNQ